MSYEIEALTSNESNHLHLVVESNASDCFVNGRRFRAINLTTIDRQVKNPLFTREVMGGGGVGRDTDLFSIFPRLTECMQVFFKLHLKILLKKGEQENDGLLTCSFCRY